LSQIHNKSQKTAYYAVKKGFKTGIFYTWDECKEAIQDFAYPRYRKFLSLEEANSFLNDESLPINKVEYVAKNESSNSQDKIVEDCIQDSLKAAKVVAFVDGSYDNEKKYYGSGVLILTPENKIIEIVYHANYEQYLKSRNVSGEVFASLIAMKWAIKNEYDKIVIFYDYSGICNWICKSWEASAPISKKYLQLYEEMSGKLVVEFFKIKAHSDNKYNDAADKLAKRSLINFNTEKPVFDCTEHANLQIKYSYLDFPEFAPEIN
jgi:ribonuclease HI